MNSEPMGMEPLAPTRRATLRPRILPFVIAASASLLAVRGLGLVLNEPSPAVRDATAVNLPIVPSALAARPEVLAPVRLAAAAASSPPSPSPSPEPSAPTRREAPTAAEVAILEELRARRQALEERERALLEREALLTAAERRLAARVEEIASLQARLEALDRAAREREDAGWRGLVRIYEQMRPRDAARIFNELEMPVLLEVVARMRERVAAPILAGMEPDKAKALTAELAARRARPGLEAPSGG